MCKAIFQDCWRSLLSHNAVVKVKILQVILLCLFAMISIARVEAANNAKAIQISTNVEQSQGKSVVIFTEKFVDKIEYKDEPVSSTRIREAIKNGDMRSAASMLGRYFAYDFEVFHGDERGRTLGSPTINQFFTSDFQVPEFGVYASFTDVDGKVYFGELTFTPAGGMYTAQTKVDGKDMADLLDIS